MKKHRFINVLVLILVVRSTLGQITPPGMGKAKTGAWVAFGLKQQLDNQKKWQSMSYIGFARKSNLNNYDPLFKPAFFILNQEFSHQFHKHWQYSLAVSYRRQYEYFYKPPYEPKTPSLKQEFRLYGRFSYLLKTTRFSFSSTFRQEVRKFYSPDFKIVSEDLQIRSRIRLQFTVNLNATKTHRLIAGSEQLFSISKDTRLNTWTTFDYSDSRFSFYYSYSSQTQPFIFSVGYMNDLVGKKAPFSAHYFGFDLILENPFKLHNRAKTVLSKN